MREVIYERKMEQKIQRKLLKKMIITDEGNALRDSTNVVTMGGTSAREHALQNRRIPMER